MGHNINVENSVASCVVAKEKPWHGLGTVLPQLFTSKEALQYGGLDFEVKKFPLHTRVRTIRIPVENKFATVRTDNSTPLGVVGNYYTPLQNADAFEFFDNITGKGGAIYESAGCLGKGEVTFLCAKLPELLKVPGDTLEMYIVLTNTHDGTRPLTAFFTPVKTVCQNTLNAGLQTAKNMVTIRHTADAKNNFMEAARLMGIVDLYTQELTGAFSRMAEIKQSDLEAVETVHMIMLTPEEMRKVAAGEEAISTRKANIVQQVVDYYLSDSTIDGIRGTKWGVYNAITGYFANVKEYRSAETKMQNIVFLGADWKFQQRAFEVCVK